MEYKKLGLDFRTKVFMTMSISYTLLLGNLQQKYLYVAVATSLLPYVFLLIDKKYIAFLRNFFLIALAFLAEKYFANKSSGLINSLALFVSILFIRLLPGLAMGYYAISSTSMSEIASSLQKLRIPDQIIIPITVLTRFFHTIREDYSQIKDAMYLHGLTTRRLIMQPVKLFEYRAVPLLMIASKTADDVAISAMTRGLKLGAKRSSLADNHFRILDYICFLLMFILIYFYIRGKYA